MRPREFDEDAVTDTVMRMFWRNGYAATSMNDIVEATGLSRSTIYSSFGGKKRLFELALTEYDKITTQSIGLISRPGHAKDAIRTLLTSVVEDELCDKEGLGCFVANSSLEFAGRDAEFAELVGRHLNRLEKSLSKTIKRGQQEGDISSNHDYAALSHYILSVIQGIRVVSKGLPADRRKAYLSNVVNIAIDSL